MCFLWTLTKDRLDIKQYTELDMTRPWLIGLISSYSRNMTYLCQRDVTFPYVTMQET
jgi:hypothetical protein